MALATRCPQCGAMFRVVADQLKLRGGLVRCGQCRTVFDAIGSLAYVEDGTLPAGRPGAESTAAPAAESPGAVAAVPAVTAASSTAATAAAPPSREAAASSPEVSRAAERPAQEAAAGTARGGSMRAAPERARRAEPRAPAERRSRDAQEQQRKALGPATTLRIAPGATPVATVSQVMPAYAERRAAPEAEQEQLGVPTLLAAGSATTDTDPMLAGIEVIEMPPLPDLAAAPPSPDEEPAFIRSGEPRARRGFSIVFSGGSLLLLLLALLQTAVVFRAELTTRWPQARPMMAKLCDTLGCTLGLPTRPEQLAVIASELQAVTGTDVLELTAVIRNRASFTQALPALEVTLSDTQNRALARKVFAPVDYLAAAGEPSSRIEEGLAAGGDLTIRVLFEARGLRPAGFLVYPFYI